MPIEVKENRVGLTRTKFHAIVDDTFDQGAGLTQANMVAKCPVSDEEYPGKVHMIETIERTPGLVGRSADGKVESAVKVGDPSQGVDYPIYVERGTSKMSAQPFAGPAYQIGKTYILERLKRSVR